MKWYKRLSNGLIAIIAVALVAVVTFLALVLVVPKLNKNTAADGFFVAVFKDPPKDEQIIDIQNAKTGEISFKLENSPEDYKLLEIKVMLVVRNNDNIYHDYDVISYEDELGVKRTEQKTITIENVKKGSTVDFSETFQPSKATLKNYPKYGIFIKVVKYK